MEGREGKRTEGGREAREGVEGGREESWKGREYSFHA